MMTYMRKRLSIGYKFLVNACAKRVVLFAMRSLDTNCPSAILELSGKSAADEHVDFRPVKCRG